MYYVLAFLLALTSFTTQAFEYGWTDRGGYYAVDSTTRTEAETSRLTLDYASGKPVVIYSMKRGLTSCDRMNGMGVVFVGNVSIAGARYCSTNSITGKIDAGWVFEDESWLYLNKVFSNPHTKTVYINDEAFPTHDYLKAVSAVIVKLESIQKEATYNQ
jgi:hypothetical protein